MLAFSSFKVGSLLSVKDPIPSGLRSCVFYKFSCAGCAACYVGETTRHFSTRVREHLETDRASHIFKHLEGSKECRSACSLDSFAIIDQASWRFALKIKEALHKLCREKAYTQCAGQAREFKTFCLIYSLPLHLS